MTAKQSKFPIFTSDKLKANYDEADWIDVITNGEGSKMPAFKDKLSAADIKKSRQIDPQRFSGQIIMEREL